MVHKQTKKVICTSYANGKKHDFRIFKESLVHFKESTRALTDTGFIGLQKIHRNTDMPKKEARRIRLQKQTNKKTKKFQQNVF